MLPHLQGGCQLEQQSSGIAARQLRLIAASPSATLRTHTFTCSIRAGQMRRPVVLKATTPRGVVCRACHLPCGWSSSWPKHPQAAPGNPYRVELNSLNTTVCMTLSMCWQDRPGTAEKAGRRGPYGARSPSARLRALQRRNQVARRALRVPQRGLRLGRLLQRGLPQLLRHALRLGPRQVTLTQLTSLLNQPC